MTVEFSRSSIVYSDNHRNAVNGSCTLTSPLLYNETTKSKLTTLYAWPPYVLTTSSGRNSLQIQEMWPHKVTFSVVLFSPVVYLLLKC